MNENRYHIISLSVNRSFGTRPGDYRHLNIVHVTRSKIRQKEYQTKNKTKLTNVYTATAFYVYTYGYVVSSNI